MSFCVSKYNKAPSVRARTSSQYFLWWFPSDDWAQQPGYSHQGRAKVTSGKLTSPIYKILIIQMIYLIDNKDILCS